LLWPGSAAGKGATNLRQRLSRLNTKFGTDVVHSGAVLSLPAHVRTDVSMIETLGPQALMASAPLLAAIDLSATQGLDDWLQQQRHRVLQRQVQALASHAEAFMQQGRLGEALPLAQRIVDWDPISEHAWRRLMRIHHLRDDRASALAAFDDCNRRLLDELGIQPGTETLQLWRTIEAALPAPPLPLQPVPVSLMQPPVLVGRTTAWHAMADAWQQQRPFLLVGDAGMGKTRLLKEFLRGRDAVVAERARPGDEQTPYALLGRVLVGVEGRFHPVVDSATQRELARIRWEFGQPWPAATRPEVLRHALEEFFAATIGSGLQAVALDDLHDADLATWEALRWLAQSPRLAALKWALALRPARTAAMQALLQKWGNDSQPPATCVLGALSQPELADLLASLELPELVDPALTARLYRHAGGHPLYTLATLQDALAHGRNLRGQKLPHPTPLQALLDARLRELPAATQPLLHVAAVAGADFSADLAAALLGCEPLDLTEPWRALEGANVLLGEAFAHDLVGEAALRNLPLGLRAAMHRKVATWLQDDPHTPPGRLAWHWEGGERWAEAGRCRHAAGLAAKLAGRLEEQSDLFERAACCHERAGDEAARFDALIERFDGMLLHGGAAAVLAEMPRIEPLAHTGLQQLRCTLEKTRALLDREEARDALAHAAAAASQATQHPHLLPAAAAFHAYALALNQQTEAALDAAHLALQFARQHQDRAQELRATNALAYTLYSAGRLGQAVPVQQDAVFLAEALGDRAGAAAAQGHLAALLASVGDVPATHAQALRTQRLHKAVGLGTNSTVGAVNHMMLGNAAAYLGRFDEALASLQAAVEQAGQGAALGMRAKARLSLANLWLTLGQPSAARELIDEMPAGAIPGMQMQAALVLARAAAMDGLPQQRHWQTLSGLAAEHPDLPLVQSAWFELSFQGDAGSMARRLAAVAAECDELGLTGTARSLRARELTRWLEVPGTSAQEQALALAHSLMPHVNLGLSAKVYPPQAWLALAAAFDCAGDTAAQVHCLQQGRDWLTRALCHVPAAHTHGFEQVNPVNRHWFAKAPTPV
jgi:hypothetical protein